MSMGTNNYEVRILQKGNWTTESRAAERESAMVTTSYRTSTGNRTIQIRVGLEVQNSQQTETMDKKLSDIVTRVAADLSRMQARDGSAHIDSEAIKQQLRKAVEEAGDTAIEGVLFKEINIFR